MPVLVGLDIGTAAVRAAAVDSSKSKLVLRRFGEMPLPPGAVDGGEILDEDAVGEAVSALWKRYKLPKRRVVVGTANQRVIVREVDVPQMDDAELKEALPFQVQDSLPIPVDEALLDYIPLDEFTTPEGEAMLSILVVAAHREMIEGILRVTDAAGLGIDAVDLQPFALVRAAFGADLALTESAPQGIVDIGATITQVVFVRNGVARFVRILPRGGENFTQALVNELEMEPEDAEELKREIGVEAEGAIDEDSEHATARRILTTEGDALIDDIRGSVNFYLSQTGDAAMERIVIAGNGARLPHLANRMGQSLDIRLEPAKVLEQIDVGRVQLSEQEMLEAQPVLPTAVGLALWGEV